MKGKSLLTAGFCSILIVVAAHAQAVVVEAVVSTTSTAGDADDPAIWIHPTNRSKSVIIGSDKRAGIYVWDMNGNELQHIPQGTKTNNVDVAYDLQLGGQAVDIAAANLRDAGKLAVFKINPDYNRSDVLVQISGKNSNNNNLQRDSYGFGLYKRNSDGMLFVFDRPKNSGPLRQYRIEDDGTGAGIKVTPVRDLNYNGGTAEGIVADSGLGVVYVAEESKGIHKYYADPAKSSGELSLFAVGDGISGDREGLALYACNDGTGYLVLSSQGNSTFKLYERQGDNRFVKTIEPRDAGGNGGLGTDGLDVTSSGSTLNFPSGFLVAHDQHGARYHVYDWAQIAEGDLTICIDGGETSTADTTPPSDPKNVHISSRQ
jgi:3-phytase